MFSAHLKKSVKAHPALGLVILGACGGFSSYTARVTEGVLEQSEFVRSFSAAKGLETAGCVAIGATLGGTLAQWAIKHKKRPELAQFLAGATGDTTVALLSAGLETLRGRKPTFNLVLYNVVVSAVAGGTRNLVIYKAKQAIAKLPKEGDKHALAQNELLVTGVTGFIGGAAAGAVRTAFTGGSICQVPINSFRLGVCVAASTLAQRLVSGYLK